MKKPLPDTDKMEMLPTNSSKHLNGKKYVPYDLFDERTNNMNKKLDDLTQSQTKVHERIDRMASQQADDKNEILRAIYDKGKD